MEFNPFGRPPETVTADHLSALLGVREGWYIDFKSELPEAKSIAKSVSSFANTYGGWLCVGVSEAVDNGHRTGFAGGFARDHGTTYRIDPAGRQDGPRPSRPPASHTRM